MLKLRFRQVHLDFHTSEKIPGVGVKFDGQEFADTLRRAHVNSVTCFSRCHHGMIYHDTKSEARHPHLECDLLAEQIRACHAVGIRVPIYITVGWDEFMAKRHPEWLERSPEGKLAGSGPLQPGWKKFCFNTPYLDYVVEQTQEVLDRFEVDGLFFDIIHQGQCCCECCMAGMEEAGLDPTRPEDRAAFARQVLDAYKRRMHAVVRERNAECSIFHNAGHIYPDWRPVLGTYTHLELESLPSGGWGYAHFPITIRYARHLGLDCLGMTGKFHTAWGDFSSFKNPAALEYECFTQLANAAKCSIGDQLHPSGAICQQTYDLIGRVYRSVEEKEPWCEDAEGCAEIAVFQPEAIGKGDARIDSATSGAYHMLIEGHHQFDYVDAECDLSPYEVLILPDKITLDDDLAGLVRRHVDGGGALIATHHSGLDPGQSRFALDIFGAEYLGEAEYSPDFIEPRAQIDEGIAPTQHVMYDRGAAVRAEPETEVLADLWQPYFNRTYKHFCSHQHTPVEKKSALPGAVQMGRVIYFPHPLFGMYHRRAVRTYKLLVLNALARLLPRPLVKTDAPTTAHVTLTRQPARRRHVVHVLHYIPERRGAQFDTVEDVIPLHGVSLGLRCDSPPGKVYLAPQGDSLECAMRDGYAQVTIPAVEGHQLVAFEE